VLAHAADRAPDSLRLVRVGGDTTLWSDIDLLRGWLAPEAAIQSIYAATEAPMMQWFVDASCRTEEPRVPLGYPLPGNHLALIDEHGRVTPAGAVGELIVESPYVALGHWVDGRCVPNGTERRDAASRRTFRSGDLVRQRPDGLLERIGRKDRQVKIRGSRVDLDGVEAVLRRHPLVSDAGALARPAIAASGADGGVTLVAYVSARDGAHAGLLDDLTEMMRAAPPPMRPGHVYLVADLPRLPSSKLDVGALMALDEARVRNERAKVADAAGGSAPADGDFITRTVADVWREVLQTPVRGPDDDFFEVGGDSLSAITFVVNLERALGVELSLTLMTEAPTFASLCDVLKRHRTMRYVPLVTLKPGDGAPPVFIIHGLGGTVAGLFPMTRRMAYPGAVIGIQARGLDGREPPHATVEAMATEYLREVKAWQPDGPYHLCGYSFGGLVAFEMARRLRESGNEVGLVGLFDTRMSPLGWPFRSWPAIVGRRTVQFARAVSATPLHRWPAAVRKSAPGSVLKVAAGALVASARYRPGFYPGDLTLFAPVGRERGLPSPETFWRTRARSVSVVETAGAHSTMFSETNAESTAALLTRCLTTRPV
jgi:thioesterase domain-containing protein/acyl carrier protein